MFLVIDPVEAAGYIDSDRHTNAPFGVSSSSTVPFLSPRAFRRPLLRSRRQPSCTAAISLSPSPTFCSCTRSLSSGNSTAAPFSHSLLCLLLAVLTTSVLDCVLPPLFLLVPVAPLRSHRQRRATAASHHRQRKSQRFYLLCIGPSRCSESCRESLPPLFPPSPRPVRPPPPKCCRTAAASRAAACSSSCRRNSHPSEPSGRGASEQSCQ